MTTRSYDTIKFNLFEKTSTLINAAAKRGMDIFFSTLGLLLLAPFLLMIALKLKREEPGPVLYRGPRLGKDGKEFGILKFRTMYARPESYAGPRITARDDQRITPTGHWLRDTKLNELPQLWNVLVGEMSLVGPRPEDPQMAKTWSREAFREILSVRPGITSPASIAYRDEEKMLKSQDLIQDYLEHIVPDKLRLDSLYVRHHNILTDFDTIFWTLIVLLPRLGKSKVPESWLFGGPLTRFLRRYLSWFAIDFLVALGCISLVGLAWRAGGPLDVGLLPAAGMGVSLALCLSFFNALLGIKSVSWNRPASEDVLMLAISCLLVGLSFWGLHKAFGLVDKLSDEFLFTACVLTLSSFVAVRYRLRLITGLASRWVALRRGTVGTGERVLVVGAGEGGDFISWILGRPDFRGYYQVVGIADDDPAKQGMRFEGLKVLGTTGDIPDLVESYDIGVIFYAIGKIAPADKERILTACHKTGLPLVLISEVIDNLRQQFARSGLQMAVDGD
jgi:lipopolysaccharide/colanic/teichoic acid biosynthesis glycosyltransferase